jgi:ATP-dependent helicase/DNAse subunit B
VAREIWLGPVLGSNRERLLARCGEYVSQGQADRLLYIAASHPLLDLVTETLLDGKVAKGVWGEFPVYLFRGLVRRILTGAFDTQTGQPLPPRVAIDREELPLRRSLISQIIKQLAAAGKLKAIKPLANRDGCVNTIAALIGELQRAGKTATDFQLAIDARAGEHAPTEYGTSGYDLFNQPRSQIDFDREVALIYAAYSEALDLSGLTDEDADQLRALQVVRGELNGQPVSLPWLEQVELLVLDGFFDFTPVQGEILRHLIPAMPKAIVNLNSDPQNEDIFRPFQTTIEQLKSISAFEISVSQDLPAVAAALAPLHSGLFNASGALTDEEAQAERPAVRPQDAGAPAPVVLLECSDCEVEIRSIAKEVKRLILTAGYRLSEIALVVRQQAAYADTILRVCADESIPTNLERRIEAVDIPAVRACGKLFQLLRDTVREHVRNPKASEIAHLIKTEYFRVSSAGLPELTNRFDERYASLLEPPETRSAARPANSDQDERRRIEKLRSELGIGRWLPDVLENVIAYVGSELRVTGWIERAQRLIDKFPSPEAATSLIAGGKNEVMDAAAAAEDEAPPDEAPTRARRRKPTPIHPAAIGWSVILMEHLQQLVGGLPAEGKPEDLRAALMLLLARLDFSDQVRRSFHQVGSNAEVPQATLDVRGLESLRRAMIAAVRSYGFAARAVSSPGAPARSIEPSLTIGRTLPKDHAPSVTLASFIDEVERSLRSQVLSIGAANRDGLRVLEATDVRGLRFRAVFIAGLIEGGFPLRTSRDWLYPHEERLRLQKHGIYLEDISTDTLLKEEHYFYQAACRAIERLYLSRPLATSAISETVPSYYIEELKRAIDSANFRTEQIRGDLDTRELSQASTAAELSTFLIRQTEHPDQRLPGRYSQAQLKDVLARAETQNLISRSAVSRVKIERQRNSERFGSFDGEITDPDLRALLGRNFGPEHVYSASGLSTFGNCSFRFFAARVLRLEPRSEAALDLQAIDAGKLLHDILRRFFEGYRKQYLPDLDVQQLRRRLSETADAVFREHEALVPPLNQRIWKIDCEIRKLILDQVLLYELRLQERTNPRRLRPAYFELAFGRAAQASDPKSTTNYLKIERVTGATTETALFQGQIDRVDVNEDDRLAVAYDYKLSQGAKLDDIESGRQVQIPIYLAALEQLFLPEYRLAGGGYYKLKSRGPRLNQGLYRSLLADCTDTTRATQVDEDEMQRILNQVRRKVWEAIDAMRAGHFRVRPALGKTTCKFCDYAAVCRYDTFRISRKRT